MPDPRYFFSQVTYIYACIILCAIPLLVVLASYGVIKLMNKRRRKMKIMREEMSGTHKKTDKVHVKEWLHQNACRLVKIKFGPDNAFYLLNRKGDKLRSMSVAKIDNMVVEISQDTGGGKKPMALIRIPNDHDLVLEFGYMSERKKFLAKLEAFLQSFKKTMETVSVTRDSMLANAETKERRKMRLEHFFREAYALTFGLKPGKEDIHLKEQRYKSR